MSRSEVRLKILHIHERFGEFGGGEVYLGRLRQGLNEMGHANRVLYLTPDGSESGLGPGEFCMKKPLGLISGSRIGAQIAEIHRTERPDVVHLHTLFSPVALARVLDGPTVLTLHNLELLPRQRGTEPLSALGLYDRLLRHLTRRALKRLDRWIAPSRAFQAAMIAEGFPAQRIIVIPHFTDARGGASLPGGDGRTLLFVGRLSAEKGILEFLDCLVHLNGRAWRVLVVGEGPLRDRAIDQVQRAGLGDRIRFAGRLDHEALESIYREAAVVVVPSMVMEAFGLVGIEAMAHSKPVVAFDAGGVREWLADGVTGILVRPGDVERLAGAVGELLDHPDRAAAMGREGARIVEERFRRPLHLAQLLAVYHEAIERRRARA